VGNAEDATPIHLACRSAGATFVNGVRRPAASKSHLLGGGASKVIDFDATLALLVRAALSLKALPRILSAGDATGAAPLHLAAAGGALGITTLLLQARAPVRQRNALSGEEPYEIAASAGHSEVADAILAVTADAVDAGETNVSDAARAAFASGGASDAAADAPPAGARARVSFIASEEAVADDAASDAAAAGGGLPGGGGAIYIHPWLQCYDPNSGYAYWFNTETSESLWEAPEDVAAKLEALGYNGSFIEGREGGVYGSGIGVGGAFCSGFAGGRGGGSGDGSGGGCGGNGGDFGAAGGGGSGGGGAGGGVGGGVGVGGGGGSGGGGGGGGVGGSSGGGGGGASAGVLSPGGTAQWVSDEGAVGSIAGGGTTFRATGARIGGIVPSALEHEGVSATGLFSPVRCALAPHPSKHSRAVGCSPPPPPPSPFPIAQGKGRALPYTPGGIPEGTTILGSDDLEGATFVNSDQVEGVQAILVAGRDAASIAAGRVLVLPTHLRERRYMTPGKTAPQAAATPAPTAEVPEPAVAPAVAPASPAKAIDVTAFPALGRYARMVRMGVPAAPVLEKMRADGVDAKIVAGFGLALEAYLSGGGASISFGSAEAAPPAASAASAESSAPAPSAQKPTEPVVPKEAAPQPAAAPAPAPSAPIADVLSDERVIKYVKMLRMGVPLPPTLMKMRSEGVDAPVVAAFEAAVAAHSKTGGPMSALGTSGAPAPASAPAPAPAPPTSPRNAAKSAAEVQKEAADAVAAEPVFEKFVKMKKMGVPLGAIKVRLTRARR
jgi:hypothetical protein